MNKNKKIAAVLFSALLLAFANVTNGQTKEEATNAYNRGVELSSTDLPKAIESLIQAADIASKAGDDAADLQKMAEGQIPLLQYNYAISLYKEKKLDEAIENFKTAHDYAVRYHDNSTKLKSDDLLPKLYLSKGNSEMKESKFEDAIASFNQAIEYDSAFAKAYLGKALVYKKQNMFDDMKAALDKSIAVAKASNDDKTLETSSKLMADEFLQNASKEFKEGRYSNAVAQLDEAAKYVDNNPEAYYLYALSYNKLSKYDEAISSSEKGLTFEDSTPEKQARFYFEIGTAQAGKNDTEAACASFKKAAVGPLTESANYQIKTVLKCN